MRVARWLSIAFHPFVTVGVMVGAAAAATADGRGSRTQRRNRCAVHVVPLAVLMWRQVRKGRWDNADASNRSERPILYVVGAGAVAALLAFLLLVRSQSSMVRGVVATLGMMAVCAVATRWVKVSLHMAFAALAATALVVARSPVGYALMLALPAIAWSRLVLQRHTPVEVALGTLIGAGAGAAIHYL